jgi:hypothetical protein
MTLLHSGPFYSLSPSFRRFGVPRFAWFLVQSFLASFSLRHATVARVVVFMQTAADFLLDPRYPSSSGGALRPDCSGG